MNCNTQNEKVELLTEEWAIVGVDVGSEMHYARVFTNRKIELSRKAFGFSNDLDGFQAFERWAAAIVRTYKLKFIMCGMEPTGHYRFNLASYMKNHGMMVVHVNISHVKHSKELSKIIQGTNFIKLLLTGLVIGAINSFVRRFVTLRRLPLVHSFNREDGEFYFLKEVFRNAGDQEHQ